MALILKRKIGQVIVIEVEPCETPQRIEVRLCDVVSPRWAKLGIEAGDKVRILREELEAVE